MTVVLFLIFITILIAVAIPPRGRRKRAVRDATEVWVEKELNTVLARRGYVIFGDLIIPSVSNSIKSTQIDHVIISPYGIFCLETKSHQGNIYGNDKSRHWKQYLGNKAYDLYSPLKQNSHHVKSLEYLLRSRLKSPIHSYIVFPSARRVKINGKELDLTLKTTIDRILNHSREVYTLKDVEAMSRGLAYVSSRSDDFMENHVEAVREFIASRDR